MQVRERDSPWKRIRGSVAGRCWRSGAPADCCSFDPSSGVDGTALLNAIPRGFGTGPWACAPEQGPPAEPESRCCRQAPAGPGEEPSPQVGSIAPNTCSLRLRAVLSAGAVATSHPQPSERSAEGHTRRAGLLEVRYWPRRVLAVAWNAQECPFHWFQPGRGRAALSPLSASAVRRLTLSPAQCD
jgi:hypothetical protein